MPALNERVNNQSQEEEATAVMNSVVLKLFINKDTANA